MSDDRINDIEATLAHQDQQIQDMSEMINSQWRDIDLLKKALDKTLARVEDLETLSDEGNGEGKSSVAEMAAAEKPPHY